MFEMFVVIKMMIKKLLKKIELADEDEGIDEVIDLVDLDVVKVMVKKEEDEATKAKALAVKGKIVRTEAKADGKLAHGV